MGSVALNPSFVGIRQESKTGEIAAECILVSIIYEVQPACHAVSCYGIETTAWTLPGVHRTPYSYRDLYAKVSLCAVWQELKVPWLQVPLAQAPLERSCDRGIRLAIQVL